MYSPKITEENVRRLYRLKLLEHKPITRLANEAISAYLNQKTKTENEQQEKEKEELCRK